MNKPDKTADNLRQVITEIFWMAQRYANGRCTYAPTVYNQAIDLAIKNGWVPEKNDNHPLYADDGDLGKWMPQYQRFEKEMGLDVSKQDDSPSGLTNGLRKPKANSKCTRKKRP
jgi:hypothetical protein